MNGTKSSHIDLALYSIKVFGNDGTIDSAELGKLLAIALQDGIIDDDERETLANIFNKVPEWELTPEVARRILEIRAKHHI
ncbi:MAG: hypothetical protein WA705_18075 [Candidatus Ozemobacteraceae bacterium]